MRSLRPSRPPSTVRDRDAWGTQLVRRTSNIDEVRSAVTLASPSSPREGLGGGTSGPTINMAWWKDFRLAQGQSF